jgi:hypothetical protein
MHAAERPTKKRPGPPPYAAAILSLLTVMLLPGAARAQWTQDANGNISTNASNVGVVANAFDPWGSAFKVIAVNANSGFTIAAGNTSGTAFHFTDRAYFDGTAWHYSASSVPVSNFYIGSGTFGVRVAPAGTAGGTLNWTNALYVNNTGNVGVGTKTPAYRLHVVGDNSSAGGYPIIKLEDTQGGGSYSWWLYSGAAGIAGTFGIYDQSHGAYRMFFDASGNVGVGTTTTTAAKLVVPNILGMPADAGGTAPTGVISTATADTAGDTSRGLYGYANVLSVTSGTATGVKGLGEALNLYEGQAAYGGYFNGKAGNSNGYTRSAYGLYAKGEMTGGSVGSTYGGYFQAAGNSTNATTNYGVYASATGNGTNYGVYSAAGLNYFNGSVGIGTTSLTHTLEVNGTINASQGITGATINATYQDVAEWVPSSQKLPAGTVVVLDTTQANHVLASTKAYDTGVAGVVSDSPGVILGQGGEGKLKVATTGRVKVRADATRAAIRVGDLLVTGETEGVAMKSIPVELGGVQMHRPGTIIGKALEPLAGGKGEILVLLSLQ